MRGDAFDNRILVQACYGSDADRAQEVLDNLDPKDLVPIDQGAVDRLAGWLSELALPSRPLSGPLLLIYASEDDIVDVAWLDKASSAACALGGTIESVVRVGQGHGDLDGSPAVPWVRERFDGFEAPNSCPWTTPGTEKRGLNHPKQTRSLFRNREVLRSKESHSVQLQPTPPGPTVSPSPPCRHVRDVGES